jgi:hypothetical protein
MHDTMSPTQWRPRPMEDAVPVSRPRMPAQRRRLDIFIGKRMAETRASRGLSLDAVSSALNISTRLAEDYEGGWVRVPPATLVNLAHLLHVRIAVLFF